MNNLEIKIVTPEGILYEGCSDMVIIPTISGEIGIMADHESLVTSLSKGQIKIFDDNEELVKKFDVKDGFVEIKDSNLLILAG
jgi:F-type H+-transporting ATPase subunit epsilon